MNLKYRRATVNDITTLIKGRIDFLEDYWGKQPGKAVEELQQQLHIYFQDVIPRGNYISFIAADGQEFAGIGGLIIREQAGTFRNPSGKTGYIFNMYTVPSYRRIGIADNILNHLLAAGKEAGITAFELHATGAGEPLYVKNGFTLRKEPRYHKYEQD